MTDYLDQIGQDEEEPRWTWAPNPEQPNIYVSDWTFHAGRLQSEAKPGETVQEAGERQLAEMMPGAVILQVRWRKQRFQTLECQVAYAANRSIYWEDDEAVDEDGLALDLLHPNERPYLMDLYLKKIST